MWAIRRPIDAGSARQECFWHGQGSGHTSTYIRARKSTRAKMFRLQRFYHYLGLRPRWVQPFHNFIHFHHFIIFIHHTSFSEGATRRDRMDTSNEQRDNAAGSENSISLHYSFTFENITYYIISFPPTDPPIVNSPD